MPLSSWLRFQVDYHPHHSDFVADILHGLLLLWLTFTLPWANGFVCGGTPASNAKIIRPSLRSWSTRRLNPTTACPLNRGFFARHKLMHSQPIGTAKHHRRANIAARDRQAVKATNQSKPLFDKGEADETADATPPTPAQLHFSVYRVNDYDLQIQHNEAVGLACEHIGVTRTKSDPYFDGTQGKRLMKIIPFNHPLSPTDLEQLRDELRARPEEERDILIVCLGKELAADAWLDDWNRLRRKGDVPNKLQVIELRTDPKYGKFIAHKPALAKVRIKRKGDRILVEVKDFISPSIVERLAAHHGLLTPQIDDWRAMVDCLMIDSAYDGHVFNIALSDIPAKKTDLVVGAYELDAPGNETTVAVKLIDMLGEEVVVFETA
jgi:hypothetical protein